MVEILVGIAIFELGYIPLLAFKNYTDRYINRFRFDTDTKSHFIVRHQYNY